MWCILAFDRTTDRLVWETDLPELGWDFVWRTLSLSDSRAENGDSFELSPNLAMIFARDAGIHSLPDELSSYSLFLDEYAIDRGP